MTTDPADEAVTRRRWLIPTALAGAAFLLIAGATTIVLTRDTDPPAPQGCTVPTTPPTGVQAPAELGPGKGLRIAEKGFSQVGKPIPAQGPHGDYISMGAVLENTSDQVAYRTPITFRPHGKNGSTVVYPATRSYLSQEIPIILPGQRIPIGAQARVINDERTLRNMQVTGFDINIGNPTWVRNDPTIFATTTTKFQQIERTPPEKYNESANIVYEYNSTYCRILTRRGIGFIFRNSSDAIIGGGLDDQESVIECPAEKIEGTASAADSIPTPVDESRTEIFVYCDFAPRQPNPLEINPPII